ncbi:MAG: glycosyltransferase family 4 protein [Gemmataceae bacterium]
MRPLHICYISQEYPPETGWGGIGSYTYEMAHGLVKAGQRVTVISLAEGEESITNWGGVEVHRVRRGPEWERWRLLWRLNRFWPGFAWAAARRLKRIHSDCPVDVVEAAENRADGFFVPLFARGPRRVVRLHTPWIFIDRLNGIVADRRKRFIYYQEARTIRSADLVTSPCQAMVDLTDTWISLKGRRVSVVPNPVNTDTYAPGEETKRGEILVVGRLEQRKGAALLAEALPSVLRRCSRAFFRFVGSDGVDASGRSWRERLLDGVPLSDRGRVQFERVSRTELIGRYRQADMCVLPSVWENFPYALLEAMACGVPAVGTRCGGLPELIEDGVSGLVIPPADATALIEALCRLLQDAELQRRMGRAARQRVEGHFSVEAVVPRMLDLYRSVRERRFL